MVSGEPKVQRKDLIRIIKAYCFYPGKITLGKLFLDAFFPFTKDDYLENENDTEKALDHISKNYIEEEK